MQNENDINVGNGLDDFPLDDFFPEPEPTPEPEPEPSPPTQIVYTAPEGHSVVIWGTAGITAEDLAAGLPGGTAWREVSREEAGMLSCTKTLDEAKAEKLAEILAGANAMSATIKARYSQPEIDSWQQQEAEARALLVDESAAAPLVRKLAANTGVSPLSFAQRIINNADNAAMATEAIILQQQAMEKIVNEAESVENVQAMSVTYTLN